MFIATSNSHDNLRLKSHKMLSKSVHTHATRIMNPDDFEPHSALDSVGREVPKGHHRFTYQLSHKELAF